MPLPRHLFVYGTLLRGQVGEGLVAALRARPATMRGRLWSVPSGYPALVPDPSGPEASGELLEVDRPGLWSVLDLYEGVGGGLYEREAHPAGCEGAQVPAWVYAASGPRARRAGCRPLTLTDWRVLGR
jgi:gamma-glutamylcyclotransferase (GGCT)/AIG2-like uncharacterized protein YtfP